MQNSVNSVNPNMKFQPNPRHVVCPPAQFYKYSLYDELKLGEDKFKEIKSALKDPKSAYKPTKTQNFLQNLFIITLITGGGVIGYKNRRKVIEFIKKIPQIFGKK